MIDLSKITDGGKIKIVEGPKATRGSCADCFPCASQGQNWEANTAGKLLFMGLCTEGRRYSSSRSATASTTKASTIYKFRSMYADQADLTASKLVTKGDPRVTRVGRFIRKTSFDELPQLFNVVFTGSLSLVGPRPHAVHAKAENRLYDEAVDGYFARHRVKPGITGWAQIHG